MDFLLNGFNYYMDFLQSAPIEVVLICTVPAVMYFTAVPFYTQFAKKNNVDPVKKFTCDTMVISSCLGHFFILYPLYTYLKLDIMTFSLWKLFLGMLVMDTFQFWNHYALHKIPGAYKYVHYVHHSMGDPSPSESVLVHPFEGVIGTPIMVSMFMFSGLSFAIFVIITGMTYASFVCEHTITTPYKYHYIHHNVNINKNFEAPFFSFWDRLMGTYHPKSEVALPYIP